MKTTILKNQTTKKLVKFLSPIIVLSTIILSCSKEESSAVKPTSQNLATQAIIRNKMNGELVVMDGGMKSSCIESGTTCKKSTTSSRVEQIRELTSLDSYIESNNVSEYFLSHEWPILFAELEEFEVAKIIDGSLFVYRLEDSQHQGGHIYVVSTAAAKEYVTTDNCLAGWEY